jgi:hypothetical protein
MIAVKASITMREFFAQAGIPYHLERIVTLLHLI